MHGDTQTISSAPLAVPQRASAHLQLGERFSVVSEVEVTSAGLLAIGAIVGVALIGSAIIVRAARS